MHGQSCPPHPANAASDLFPRQKPVDICVQVYRVRSEEASQALQNGTEETVPRGRGEFRKRRRDAWQQQPFKPCCHVSRGSRGRGRILQGGPKPSGQSRPAPAETPLVLSCPPNLHPTPASPAPTGTTTESLTTQPINATLAVTVRGGGRNEHAGS